MEKKLILLLSLLLFTFSCKKTDSNTNSTNSIVATEEKNEEQVKVDNKVPTSSPTESKSTINFNESNVEITNTALEYVNRFSVSMPSDVLYEKIRDILNIRSLQFHTSKGVKRVICDGVDLHKRNDYLFSWKLPLIHSYNVVNHNCEVFFDGESEARTIVLKTKDNVDLMTERDYLEQSSQIDLLILNANIDKQIKVKNFGYVPTHLEAKTIFVIQNMENERTIISNQNHIFDQSLINLDFQSALDLISENLTGDKLNLTYTNYTSVSFNDDSLDASDNNEIDPVIYQSCLEGKKFNLGNDGRSPSHYIEVQDRNYAKIKINIKNTLTDPVFVRTDIKKELLNKGKIGGKGGLGRRYFAWKTVGKGEDRTSLQVECPRQRGTNGNDLESYIEKLPFSFGELIHQGLILSKSPNAKIEIMKDENIIFSDTFEKY